MQTSTRWSAMIVCLLVAVDAAAFAAEATVAETKERLTIENDSVKLVLDATANYVPIELRYKRGSNQNLIAATDAGQEGGFSFCYGYKAKDGSVRWVDENNRRDDKIANPQHKVAKINGAVSVDFSGDTPHFRLKRRITVPASGPATKFRYDLECTAPWQNPLISQGVRLPRAPLWPKLNKEAIFHDEFIGADGRKTTGMIVRNADSPALHPGGPYARAECFFNDQTGEGVVCAPVLSECSGVNNLNLYTIAELKETLTFLVIPFQGEYEKIYRSHINTIKDPPVVAHGNSASSSAVILSTTPEVVLWADHGSRKVFPEEPIPATAGEAGEFAIEMAKGEFEPFQIVVTSRIDLDDVRVVPDSLTDAKGNRLAAENLKCNPIGPLMSCVDEEIPDLLLQKSSISCTKGQNSVFWITIKTPPGTPAGVYRGKLAVTSKGEKLGDVPLRLKVWDFLLPQTPHLYNFSYEDLYYFDGEVDLTHDFLARSRVRTHSGNWTDEEKAKYRARMKFFADHRIVEAQYGPGYSGNIDPRWHKNKDGRWDFDIDFTGFDKARDYCYNQLHWPRFGYDCGLFPYLQFINQSYFGGKGGKEYAWIMQRWDPVLPKKDPKKYAPQFYDLRDDFTPEFKEKFSRYVKTISEHCRAKGICVDENGNGPVCFLADEIPPFSSNHPVSKKTLELARLVKQADPKTIVVVNLDEIPDDPEILNLMDMWSARGTAEKLEKVKRMGRRIGDFYNEMYFSIRNPAIDPRVQYWSYWKAGFSFIGNWMMSISLDNIRGGRYGRVPDGPYKNYVINWYFPNMQGRYGEPMSTIRFELMREGMEDYEYLWMLADQVKRLKAAPPGTAEATLLARAESLLKRAEKVGGEHRPPPEDCRVFKNYLRDPVELLRLRHEIGDTLEALMVASRATHSAATAPRSP